MNRFPTQLFIVMLASLMLVGCAGRESQPVYIESQEISPIRAPQGLDTPAVRSTFQLGGYFLPEMAGLSEARPPRVLPSAEAEASNSHIRFGPRGLYLEVQDEADSVWRRLGFSLNRGGMQVREVKQEQRQYAFRFNHDPMVIDRSGLSRLAFWRSNERVDYSGDFLARIEPSSAQTTQVLLLDAEGNLVDMERAEYVLSLLRERLG